MRGSSALLLLLFLSAESRADEPGASFVGATFTETFEKEGTLTAKVISYHPPDLGDSTSSISDVETRGLYKVKYSDGDHAHLYYEDLIKKGASLAGATDSDTGDGNKKDEL